MEDTKQLELLVDVLEGAVSDSAKKTPQMRVRAWMHGGTYLLLLLGIGGTIHGLGRHDGTRISAKKENKFVGMSSITGAPVSASSVLQDQTEHTGGIRN
jgi:hypothetical protein